MVIALNYLTALENGKTLSECKINVYWEKVKNSTICKNNEKLMEF